MKIPYAYTDTGLRYIPEFTSFNLDFLNELAYTYNIHSNRVYGDILKLPHTREEIQLQPNEQITSGVINSKLTYLYINYLYILTRCKIGKVDGLADYRGSTHIPPSVYTTALTGRFKTQYGDYIRQTQGDWSAYQEEIPWNAPLTQELAVKIYQIWRPNDTVDEILLDPGVAYWVSIDITVGDLVLAFSSSAEGLRTGISFTGTTTVSSYNILTSDIRGALLTDHKSIGLDSYIIATKNRLLLFKYYINTTPNKNCVFTAVSRPDGEMLVDSSSDMEFDDIISIATNHRGVLYTLDGGTNVIYKHNIRGLTRDDRILLTKKTTGRQQVRSVGGHGSVKSKTKFNAPISMIFENSLLYVMDSAERDYRVKVYDEQFNWISTYNLSLDYITNTPIDISINAGILYVLTEQGHLYCYKLADLEDGRLSPDIIHTLSDIDHDFNLEERYIELKFSPTNTNICYVVTNRTVYKKYVDRLTSTVGNVDWKKHNIASTEIHPRLMSITDSATRVGDAVLLLADVIDNDLPDDHQMMLMTFRENENILDILADDYESQIYKLTDILIDSEEYVSSFVYNKALAKMLYNIDTVFDNIKYVPTRELNSLGALKYPGIRYISEDEISTARPTPSVTDYVGINELVGAVPINRCLSMILDKQTDLLAHLTDRVNIPSFYAGGTVHLKRTPVQVLEHKLASGASYKIQKI